MKRIRSTNDRLVDVIVFDPKKNIKLQPVTPLMPLEALLIPVNLTDSDSYGINGGTGCNFIFFSTFHLCTRIRRTSVNTYFLLFPKRVRLNRVLLYLIGNLSFISIT